MILRPLPETSTPPIECRASCWTLKIVYPPCVGGLYSGIAISTCGRCYFWGAYNTGELAFVGRLLLDSGRRLRMEVRPRQRATRPGGALTPVRCENPPVQRPPPPPGIAVTSQGSSTASLTSWKGLPLAVPRQLLETVGRLPFCIWRAQVADSK
jgi:hypothetical protein